MHIITVLDYIISKLNKTPDTILKSFRPVRFAYALTKMAEASLLPQTKSLSRPLSDDSSRVLISGLKYS